MKIVIEIENHYGSHFYGPFANEDAALNYLTNNLHKTGVNRMVLFVNGEILLVQKPILNRPQTLWTKTEIGKIHHLHSKFSPIFDPF